MKWSKAGFFLFLILALLAVDLIALLSNKNLSAKIRHLHNQVDSLKAKVATFEEEARLIGVKIPNFTLVNVQNDHMMSLGHGNQRYRLLLLFSTEDCSKCLNDEFSFWADLLRKVKPYDISLLAVATSDSKSALIEFLYPFHLEFPILYDEKGQLRKIINMRDTPAKLLLDSDGMIILANLFADDEKRQRHFIEQLLRVTDLTVGVSDTVSPQGNQLY